jgi:hypothetical protein
LRSRTQPSTCGRCACYSTPSIRCTRCLQIRISWRIDRCSPPPPPPKNIFGLFNEKHKRKCEKKNNIRERKNEKYEINNKKCEVIMKEGNGKKENVE